MAREKRRCENNGTRELFYKRVMVQESGGIQGERWHVSDGTRARDSAVARERWHERATVVTQYVPGITASTQARELRRGPGEEVVVESLRWRAYLHARGATGAGGQCGERRAGLDVLTGATSIVRPRAPASHRHP